MVNLKYLIRSMSAFCSFHRQLFQTSVPLRAWLWLLAFTFGYYKALQMFPSLSSFFVWLYTGMASRWESPDSLRRCLRSIYHLHLLFLPLNLLPPFFQLQLIQLPPLPRSHHPLPAGHPIRPLHANQYLPNRAISLCIFPSLLPLPFFLLIYLVLSTGHWRVRR